MRKIVEIHKKVGKVAEIESDGLFDALYEQVLKKQRSMNVFNVTLTGLTTQFFTEDDNDTGYFAQLLFSPKRNALVLTWLE